MLSGKLKTAPGWQKLCHSCLGWGQWPAANTNTIIHITGIIRHLSSSLSEYVTLDTDSDTNLIIHQFKHLRCSYSPLLSSHSELWAMTKIFTYSDWIIDRGSWIAWTWTVIRLRYQKWICSLNIEAILTMIGSCNFSVMNFEFGVCSQNKMLSKFSAFDPPDADE